MDLTLRSLALESRGSPVKKPSWLLIIMPCPSPNPYFFGVCKTCRRFRDRAPRLQLRELSSFSPAYDLNPCPSPCCAS
jgi:hypothetical protein